MVAKTTSWLKNIMSSTSHLNQNLIYLKLIKNLKFKFKTQKKQNYIKNEIVKLYIFK